MMLRQRSIFAYAIVVLLSASCKRAVVVPDVPSPDAATSVYFPPNSSEIWETSSPVSLGWDTSKLADLYDFLAANNTRALIILKDGKIVVERYWGKEIIGGGEFTAESNWYWASAGKSLTATLVGLAQQEGFLNIDGITSDYLGQAWSSLSAEKESLIHIKEQLSMTTGLDYSVVDPDCTAPACLQYGVDPGQQWFYHNGPYTLVEQVVSKATEMGYNNFSSAALTDRIGMKGLWIKSGYNNVYWSDARSAARFGLFSLAKGSWNNAAIVTDSIYYQQMVNSSQTLNPAYGYFWWLNGKESFKLPGSPTSFIGSLAPNAPADLIAAMGKNGQFINVIPSEQMVVVRFGEAPDNALVPALFHNEMWGMLTKVLAKH
jgi:CubicO group peptidase (beta-lactamase class C family)